MRDASRQSKLRQQIDQVHDDNNQEYLPEDSKDHIGLSGHGHINEGTADIEGQKRDDSHVKNTVDDGGEVLHSIVESVSDLLLTSHGGQAEAQHKGQNHCGNGIQKGRDFN